MHQDQQMTMKQSLHDLAQDIIKGLPAGVAGVVSSVTADDVYKWVGIAWLLMLIVDKLFPNIWAKLAARLRGVPYEPPQK